MKADTTHGLTSHGSAPDISGFRTTSGFRGLSLLPLVPGDAPHQHGLFSPAPPELPAAALAICAPPPNVCARLLCEPALPAFYVRLLRAFAVLPCAAFLLLLCAWL